MKLVSQLLAQRRVHKLKDADSLSPPALEQLTNELVEMGSSAVPPLIDCLSRTEARAPAMEVLDRLLDDATLDTYMDAMSSSSDPAIVRGVADVLAKNRRYDATRLLSLLTKPGISKPMLERLLQEKSSEIPSSRMMLALPDLARDGQAVVFRALEKRTDLGQISGLLALLVHQDPWIRSSAARLLSRYVDDAAVTGIRGLLADKVPNVRLEAVQALRKMNAGGAVPDLVSLLRDGDFKVQSATIDALCAIADASAVSHLISVLADESDYARRGAVEVLNVVATPEAIQDLVRALADEDWWVRVRAADALGTLGGEKVVQAVIGLMNAEDENLRRHAVEILNAVPNQAAAEALIRGLDDSDWWVRERSIDALGKTRDPRAVEPLLRLMARDEGTAPLCARALSAIGDPRAVEPLTRLLEAEREDARREALEALKNFPQGDLPSREKALLHDSLAKARGQGPTTRSSTTRTPLPVAVPVAVSAAPRPAPASEPAEPAIVNFSDLPVGTVLLRRFQIVRKIGQGGFGAVYLVEDTAVQDRLILKIVGPQFSHDENAVQRFIQELKIARRVTHKNVIRVYDLFDLGGARAVSMEYFPSTDLGSLLRSAGPIEVGRALRILAQVCEGLAAAHAEGVIHRDIKPGNILVGKNDMVKVVDFGLAAAQQHSGAGLTKSGILIGTPEYMAPEQITGESVDHRADLYSVGILMYEMFSGGKPFMADTPVKVLFQHLEGEVEPLRSRVKDLPSGVEDLVNHAMARDPNQRPQSASALRNLIEKELEALGASST